MKEARLLKFRTLIISSFCLPLICLAQVNSGSNGSDGALDYSGSGSPTNIVIDMHDHPNGVYQYTYVNISSNWRFSFIPNANNTPVTWLVQSNVVINGVVDVSGQNANALLVGIGGPGGGAGGAGGSIPTSGQGIGAGSAGGVGGGASFGSLGTGGVNVLGTNYSGSAGQIYGNQFLVPLIGGSGGGGGRGIPDGNWPSCSGGGGGGAILIAAPSMVLNGQIRSMGGSSGNSYPGNICGGGGSGGGIRLVTGILSGTGVIQVSGGSSNAGSSGGTGRVRLDVIQSSFAGQIYGSFSQGSQFIIIPTSGQLPQLTVTSVGGVPVSASPSGQISTPDAVLSAQQNNPIPVVVSCANLPLNTQITVSVKPANGAAVSATGYNTTGTLASSTATISINIPRGGGLIYATAATN